MPLMAYQEGNPVLIKDMGKVEVHRADKLKAKANKEGSTNIKTTKVLESSLIANLITRTI